MTKNYENFMKTASYKKLVTDYSLERIGLWEVRGEDPNAELAGPHYQPLLGLFEGRLQDVIKLAVELPSFWQWGSGGTITLVKVVKIDEEELKKITQLREQEESLKRQLAEVQKQLAQRSILK